jgi:hypothetical protein
MFIIRGRRLINFILVVAIIVLVVIIVLTGKNNYSDFVDTVSLPVSGKTVVIDAGHGVPDERCSVN